MFLKIVLENLAEVKLRQIGSSKDMVKIHYQQTRYQGNE